MKNICLIFLVFLLCISGCDSEKGEAGQKEAVVAASPKKEGTIVALGDSLSAGLGLDLEDSYPAQLQDMLFSNDYNFRVVNAGVSGETTSGMLSRLDWILGQKPDIVILEIGANDGLRGININLIEKNLRQILQKLQKEGVITVFTGMKMVWNLGEEYTRRYNAIFPDLAQETGVIFMPFFLEDVATVKELNREDGLHPNKKGYGVITKNLYPYVLQAIDTFRKKKTNSHK